MKKKQEQVQFRYYEIPKGTYILPLLGEEWIKDYGHDIDDMHFHNHLEIGYCYRGDGELLLGNRVCPYFPETFSVIPSNYPHSTISRLGEPSAWEYLFIDVESFVRSMYPENSRAGEELLRRVNADALFMTCENQPRVGNLIQEIIREYREKGEFYLEAVKGYLLALIFEIARLQEKGMTSINFLHAEDFTQIGNALSFVNECYAEQIKVQDLAEKCNLSETHFRRLFLKKMNMAPADYINQIRIHAACMLMQDSTLTIEEVAMRSGFISMSTFNRNFKKILGVSPKQWRMEDEKNSINLKKYKILVEEGW